MNMQENLKEIKLWQVGLFMVAVFIMGLYVGILQGERKSRYTAVTAHPGACWIIDTHTGHLYWRLVGKTIDLGNPNSTIYEEIRPEKFDIDKIIESAKAEKWGENDVVIKKGEL